MNKEIFFTIYGTVQGVFFRSNAKKMADRLNIKGFVQNMPDGTIEIIAQGRKKDLEKLEKWAWQGPKAALVNNIQKQERKAKKIYKDFQIIY